MIIDIKTFDIQKAGSAYSKKSFDYYLHVLLIEQVPIQNKIDRICLKFSYTSHNANDA